MKLTGKSVMVTGGAGFIGSHLVDRIVRDGPANLVVVDNLFLGKRENLAEAFSSFPGLKFYEQDVSDYDAMRRIVTDEDVEVVFNLAVIPLPTSLERPRWTVDLNVAMTTTICELQREGLFETLVEFSSSEVYGSAAYVPMDEAHPHVPSTPYAASKIATDYVTLSYAKTFGLDSAILRPFNNFGPRQNEAAYAGIIPIVIGRALQDLPVVIFGDGEQTRDFIFVRDVADAAVRIYEEPATRGQVVNVAGGREISVNRLVREILRILDVDVPIQYEAPRPADVRRHCGGVDRARALIGFQPDEATSHRGLVETVEWYRQRMVARSGGA